MLGWKTSYIYSTCVGYSYSGKKKFSKAQQHSETTERAGGLDPAGEAARSFSIRLKYADNFTSHGLAVGHAYQRNRDGIE